MAEKAKKKVNVHYIKNPSYREIHVDGLFGGLTPKGKISMNFFAERMSIPKCEEYDITDEGKTIGAPRKSEDSKDGVIREIEFSGYFDIEIIKELRIWLDQKIKEHETYFPKPKL